MIEFNRENVFMFLDAVRETGAINMLGAVPYIIEEFSCTRDEARDMLLEWMRSK